MTYIVYLDMDGVLADFRGHALSMFGHKTVSNKKQFWQAVRHYQDALNKNFWYDLPVLDRAHDLVSFLKNHDKVASLNVLSVAGLPMYRAKQQKIKWIEKHFPNTFDDIFIIESGKMKAHYADSNSVLIDDRKDLVQGFVDAGGHAIHYDVPYNQAIKKVREFFNG